MIKQTVFVLIFAIFLFVSCSSEPDSLFDSDQTLIAMEEEQNDEIKLKNKIIYSIPSPNEQFDLLYFLNDAVKPTVINPLSNVSLYSTNSKKALNFGVYISDAAYLMRYDQGKRVFLDYVSTLEKLGQDLDITKIYGEELVTQVEEIGADTERLFEISSQNYLTIYDQLIENNKGVELALILGGSWIETMHILFNSSKQFNENIEVQGYIVDQRFVLENLKGFVEEYKNDVRLEPLLGYFERLGSVYKKLECEKSNLEIESEDGIMILNGGTTCTFTSSSYKEMKSIINQIRTSIIS